jgi:uncharacterized repeat protein (TIGR01451 family)
VAPAPGSGVSDNFAGNNSSTAAVTVQVTGDLAIAITPNPLATVVRGQILPYVITVTNPGTTTMSGLVTSTSSGAVTGLTTYSCTSSAGSTCNGATGLGTLNRTVTVAPGGNVTFAYATGNIFGIPIGVGVATNAAFGSTITASASLGAVAGYSDTNAVNNSTSVTSTVVARANLALTNTSNAAALQGDANYTYTVRVTNTGTNLDTIAGIGLSNPLPADVVFQSWTCATTGGGSSCGGGASSGAISRTITVANNGSVTFTVTAHRTNNTIHGATSSVATATMPANTNQASVTGSPATATVTFS